MKIKKNYILLTFLILINFNNYVNGQCDPSSCEVPDGQCNFGHCDGDHCIYSPYSPSQCGDYLNNQGQTAPDPVCYYPSCINGLGCYWEYDTILCGVGGHPCDDCVSYGCEIAQCVDNYSYCERTEKDCTSDDECLLGQCNRNYTDPLFGECEYTNICESSSEVEVTTTASTVATTVATTISDVTTSPTTTGVTTSAPTTSTTSTTGQTTHVTTTATTTASTSASTVSHTSTTVTSHHKKTYCDEFSCAHHYCCVELNNGYTCVSKQFEEKCEPEILKLYY